MTPKLWGDIAQYSTGLLIGIWFLWFTLLRQKTQSFLHPKIARYRKLIFIVLLALPLYHAGSHFYKIRTEFLSNVDIQRNNWQRYSHQAGSFSALFPDKPEETVRNYQQEGTEYAEYKLQSTKGLSDFRVVITPIPKGFQFDLKVLGENAVNNLTSKGMTIVQKSFDVLDGREVLNMVVKNDDQLNTRMRMYVDHDKYYMIIAVVPKDQSDSKAVTDFLGSVQAK